ncbi:polymerase [Curtobacterium phage Parvaparticeps]|nr:polymerase [Curtobacterium phage Parvaparticeps]
MSEQIETDDPRIVLPSMLLAWGEEICNPIAWDTETSGLFVDSGARISTVSVAWIDHEVEALGEAGIQDSTGYVWADWLELGAGRDGDYTFDGRTRYQFQWLSGIVTYGWEVVDPRKGRVPVVSFAWPFDQDVDGTGKAEDSTGAMPLWPETENLPREEFEALLQWFRERAEDAGGLTAHHAKFDLHQTEAGVRRWPGLGVDLADLVTWDTQNGADLMTGRSIITITKGDPRPTTSLKPTAKFLWGEDEGDEQKVIADYLKKKKLPKGRWDLMPWGVIAKYADQDARLTARLRLWQETVGREQTDWFLDPAKRDDPTPNKLTFDRAMERRLEVSKMLRRVERRGLPWSPPVAVESQEEIRGRMAGIDAQVPFPLTLNNLKHFWFGKRGEMKNGIRGSGFPVYATTAGGAPSLTQVEVDKAIRDALPYSSHWRDLQKLQNSLDRWYVGWNDRAGLDGRLRTSVRQNGTVSGRFSVENIQLQAIPHDYKLQNFEVLNGIPSPRSVIDAGVPDGWALHEMDLAQAELRVAALYAGCQTMLDLIDQGADMHGETAKELFNTDPDDPRWGQWRQVAKRGNFSFIFGVGWETFAESVEKESGLVLSEREARSIVTRWNGIYPEFRAAIDYTSRVIEKRQRQWPDQSYRLGWVETVNGERRWFLPGEDLHKGFNQRVQGNLAQYGIDLWLAAEQYLMGQFGDEPIYSQTEVVGRVGLVLMVHDSLVLLLPKDDHERHTRWISEMGERLWAERFPGVPGALDVSAWAAHS